MTDDFGEQMRAAAAAATARVVRPPVSAVRRRLVRRRAAAGAVVAAGVVLVAFAGAGALEQPSGLRPVAPPTASGSATPVPSASPTPSPTESPTTTPPAAPATIVAGAGYDREGPAILLMSAVTGRVVRSLDVNQGEGPVVPVVSYDRKTVYFSRVQTSCTNEIVAVPSRGGPETVLVVTSGHTFAVSPDGHWLAYLDAGESCDRNRQGLVVRDLRSGTERHWTARAAQDGSVLGIAWAPDSRHLAVIRELPGRPEDVEPGSSGGAKKDLWVLDTRAPGTTVDSGRKVADGRRDVLGLCDVLYRGPEGALVVVECPYHLQGPSELVEIDPESGRRTTLATLPNAIFVDYDASGRHLLFVDDQYTLFRWVAGRAVRVAADIIGADW